MAKEKIDAASLIDKAKEKIDAVVHYAGETQEKFGKVKEEIGDLVETVSAKRFVYSNCNSNVYWF